MDELLEELQKRKKALPFLSSVQSSVAVTGSLAETFMCATAEFRARRVASLRFIFSDWSRRPPRVKKFGAAGATNVAKIVRATEP